MNEDRLYFPQQPYHWIGAEEEIASKEEMFQDNNIVPYEVQNYYLNHFRPNYSNCDLNTNDATRYNFSRGNLFPQIESKPNYVTAYKSHSTYARPRDNSGKSPLLKKMLQAPVGVSLEEIARPDPYLANWPNSHEYSAPNELFNDDNSDTITADSTGNELDTWDGYRYNNNGLLPNNFFFQKPVQGMDVTLTGNSVLQYQNNSGITIQERCRSWLASNLNPSNNNIDGKKDSGLLSICYNNGQIQCQQPRMDLTFLSNQDPLENETVFTDLQGNPCSSYYAQDIADQTFGYYGQNGSENNNFVLPDQQPFTHQDTPTNFVDCNDQYNYEFKYDSNNNNGITYTVLDDNKGIQSNILAENEINSSTGQGQSQIIESRNNETLELYWPSWRSDSENKSRNLEILLNVRSTTKVDLSRDELAQVNYCCKTPVMSEKINAINLNIHSQSNGLPVENRQHNFNSYPQIFHFENGPVVYENFNNLEIEDMLKETLKGCTMTDMDMDVSLEQSGDFNYYFVQDYQECNIEGEIGEVATAILMPITGTD